MIAMVHLVSLVFSPCMGMAGGIMMGTGVDPVSVMGGATILIPISFHNKRYMLQERD